MKKYKEYKDPQIEWIDQIPLSWSTSRIKYLANTNGALFIDGDWIESDVITESGIRYITTGNVGEGFYKEQGNGYISEETFHDLNCTEVFEGDLLISRLNIPIGRACIVPNLNSRIVTSVDNVILRPKKNIHKNFLLYVFSCKEYFDHTSLIARGATMQRVSRGLLGNIKIPIPSFNEQITISSYLDYKTTQLDTLVSKKEKLIELLQEETTAIINQAVTKGLNLNVPMKDSGIEWLSEIPQHWKITKLCYLTTEIGDGLHGTPEYVDDSENYFINGNNIGEGSIRLTEQTKKVGATELQKNRKDLNERTILLSINGTIGNLAYYQGEKVMLGKSVAYINCMYGVSREFIYYVLKSEIIKAYFNSELSGSTIKNLSLYTINKAPVTLPPFDEQEQIVLYIKTEYEKINQVISKINNEIELLREYKTALISEVVTGKVDVRGEVLN